MPGHVIHVFNNSNDVLNHLLDSDKQPFEIINNTLLVLREAFYKLQNVS